MGEHLTLPGIDRRDFLKYCAYAAGLLGLEAGGTAQVAAAIEELAARPRVVWGSFQACTGCAVHLLQVREPNLETLILQQISLDYQENVMAAAGQAAEALWEEVTSEEGFYFVAEGSIPTKIPEAVMIGGRTAGEILLDAVPNAAAVIAIGSCAAFGNIQASRPNPTGAVGIQEFLTREMAADAPAVVNLPRCPGHGDDLVVTLVSVLVTGKVPELDAQGRPLFLYGQTIHDSCYRRGHFEAGEFVERFGDARTKSDWCLYKVGCKGPVTYAPCGKNLWNNNVSWCVHNAPCQGCSEANFWDDLTPFFEQVRGGILNTEPGVSAETIGLVAGAATAVGIGGYAVAQNNREKKAGRSDRDIQPTERGER